MRKNYEARMKTFKQLVKEGWITPKRSAFINLSAGKRYEKHTKAVGFDDSYTSETNTTDEIKALQFYTAQSHDLNHALIHKTELPDLWKKYEPHLQNAFKYQTPRNMILYHGATFNPEKHIKNGELRSPAYLSTSYDFVRAVNFSSRGKYTPLAKEGFNIFKIHVPKGSKIAYANAYEHEVILPKNSRLKFLGKTHEKTVETRFQNPLKVKVWHFKLREE